MKSVDRKHHWTQISREPTPFTPFAYIVDHTNLGEVVKDNNATAVEDNLDNETNDFFDAQEPLSGTSSTDDEITSGLERYVSLCSLISKFHDARGDKLVYNLGSEMEDFFDTQDSSSVTSSIDDEITFEFHEAREGDLVYDIDNELDEFFDTQDKPSVASRTYEEITSGLERFLVYVFDFFSLCF